MFELEYNKITIPVYEYADAYKKLAELAIKYKDDISVVSRGGKGRNKQYYYNYPCSFDIETTTIRSGDMDYYSPNETPIGLVYLCQFNIYGSVFMVRTQREAMELFSWIGELFCHDSRQLIIFDHNLGYEYQFFKSYWELEYKRCFALDIHHPVTLKLTNGILLRDSYKMSNMSLDTLTNDWSKIYFKAPEIMNYSRKRTPYTKLDKDTLLYSALDVLGLSEAIGYYLEARGAKPWTNSPTSTSFVRGAYKKAIGIGSHYRTKEQKQYFKILQKCKINADIYSMLLREARGGNTHANRRFTGQLIGSKKGSGVVHFDITSSYPAQMVCYPEYPINVWRPLNEDCSLDTIKLFEANGYCTLFDIVLLDPAIKEGVTVPYIPSSKAMTLKGDTKYSDNGRYLYGAEQLRITIFGIEWPIIERQYNLSGVVILGGYFAKKGYLPDILRRFVLDLYAQKTQLKGVAGKEIEYALAKAYVNSVYGMAYTRIIREKCDFDSRGIFLKDPPEIGPELERYQKSTSYFMPYAWGAMVACLGRVYLQKMIDAVGEDFIYADTDSVFAKNPEKSRAAMKALEKEITSYQRECGLDLVYYDIKGKPHELGGIDEEPECSIKTWGAKKYITIEEGKLKCTVAGVPKKPGAEIIRTPGRFKLGLVFKGRRTNKLCLWYNENEDIIVHDRWGRPIEVKSNIAMLPVDYLLSLSDDYTLCLQIEGINSLYSFGMADKNMVEEYIN